MKMCSHDKDISKITKVSYTVFTGTVGIFVIAMGWMFLSLNSMQEKVETATEARNEINIQLAEIRTDVEWIRKSIENDRGIVIK